MSTRVIGSLLSVVLLAALTLGVFALTSNKLTPEEGRSPGSLGNPNRSQAEMLPVTLRAGGFVLREITKPAGDYVLSINNLSGVSEVIFRLDRETEGRMHEAKVLRRKPYWRQQIRLTPGTYLISEANHPEWICYITVTPR